jgi:hypothetical protein
MIKKYPAQTPGLLFKIAGFYAHEIASPVLLSPIVQAGSTVGTSWPQSHLSNSKAPRVLDMLFFWFFPFELNKARNKRLAMHEVNNSRIGLSSLDSLLSAPEPYPSLGFRIPETSWN